MVYLCSQCTALNKFPNDEEKDTIVCQRCQSKEIVEYKPFGYAEGTKVTDKDGLDITADQEDDMNIMAYQSYAAGAERMKQAYRIKEQQEDQHLQELLRVQNKILLPNGMVSKKCNLS